MIIVCDVGPRDGLQNHARQLTPERRAELVTRLAACGMPRIEVASFVSPKAVPRMAYAEAVVDSMAILDDTVAAGLVLNERGFERLAESGLQQMNFAFAASDTFNRANSHATAEQGLERALHMIKRAARHDIFASVTIATAFGCPFEGKTDAGRVLDLAARLADEGCREIVVADTIGVATPRQVEGLIDAMHALDVVVGAHLHDTRGTGLANAYAALTAGATVLDASIGGLGGCPFAPGAAGNISTEDLVYMLGGDGVELGIDLDGLIDTARWLSGVLGGTLPGHVQRAGRFRPVPRRLGE